MMVPDTMASAHSSHLVSRLTPGKTASSRGHQISILKSQFSQRGASQGRDVHAAGLTSKRGVAMASSSRDPRQFLFPGERDDELRQVLDLASCQELKELSDILYGSSWTSPLVKSLTTGDGAGNEPITDDIIEAIVQGQVAARDSLLVRLEARFLFLAADSRLVLSQRRPSYRSVLLAVRDKLKIQCSHRLSTPDLEAEIFLILLQDYSGDPAQERSRKNKKQKSAENEHRRVRDTQFRGAFSAALKMAKDEILETVIKGSSALTVSTLQKMAVERLTGKVLLEKARFEVAKEIVKQGGKAVAGRIEAQLALLTARQGLRGAAAGYAGLQSVSMLIGPLLWGTFLADVVIRSIGTDYARVIRAVFAIAQIRLTRTYGWTMDK